MQKNSLMAVPWGWFANGMALVSTSDSLLLLAATLSQIRQALKTTFTYDEVIYDFDQARFSLEMVMAVGIQKL